MTSRRQLLGLTGLTGLTTALGVMSSLTPCRWAAAQERTVVSLGTATPGGGFPVYGAAFSETINQTDPTLHVQPRNTKGSLENIPLIESGQVDLALVTGEPLYEARNGIGIGSGKPPANLRLLTAMYSSPGMFAVNGDSPVRRIADLLGKPVSDAFSDSASISDSFCLMSLSIFLASALAKRGRSSTPGSWTFSSILYSSSRRPRPPRSPTLSLSSFS